MSHYEPLDNPHTIISNQRLGPRVATKPRSLYTQRVESRAPPSRSSLYLWQSWLLIRHVRTVRRYDSLLHRLQASRPVCRRLRCTRAIIPFFVPYQLLLKGSMIRMPVSNNALTAHYLALQVGFLNKTTTFAFFCWSRNWVLSLT